jgi:ABC-type lipoprotein export system ATPase subunit
VVVLLRCVAERGSTVILATHDPDIVVACDQTLQLGE